MERRDLIVVWSADAERDIDGIWDYLASEASMRVADMAIRKIVRAGERLERHPFAGRPRDDLIPGMRSTLASPYTVFYRIAQSNLEIVRVLHQRRDIDAVFGDDLDR
jgi:toxin ParE1/3/4